MDMWYKKHVGKRFRATLGIHENARGEKVPAFMLSEPPFFPVMPLHCRVVEEKVYDSNHPD